jgi:hypothetical protein
LSIFVVLVTHFLFGGLVSPIGFAAFLAFAAFVFDLATFIYALLNWPYTACGNSNSKPCETVKAAIGLDCVLWYFRNCKVDR